FANFFTSGNLDGCHLPGHRRGYNSVSNAMPADTSARGKLELVGIALVERDHPLIIAETGYCGELTFVRRDTAIRTTSAKGDLSALRSIEPETDEPEKRLLVLVNRKRNRSGPAPERLIRLGIRHDLFQMAFDESCVDFSGTEFRLQKRVEQEPGIRPDGPDFDLVENRSKLADRLRAILAPCDQLG